MQNDLFGDTLAEAKQQLRNNWEKGMECPCCGQFVKLYRRKITGETARGLIRVYHWGGADRFVDIWQDTRKDIRGRPTGGGDFAKARFWNLIVQEDNPRTDGSKRNGYWKLTRLGTLFVLRQVSIPKYAYVFNNTCYKVSGPKVDIVSALGEQFNYRELMQVTV